MPRLFRALCLLSLVLLCGAITLGEARAQSLPIPGLPGGLGGVLTPETEPAAPDTAPPQDAPQDAPQSPSAAVQDPTRALIDILRDDQAREALIRELEAASAGRAAGAAPDAAAPGSPPANGAPVAPPAAAAPDEAGAPVQQPVVETFADRAVAATRRIGEAVYEEIEKGWLRIRRVPNTFRLSTRIFENGALERALTEIVWLAVFIYGALIVLRLIMIPIRRSFVRSARNGQWTKTLVMRILASGLALLAIPLAVVAGLTAFVVSGFASPALDGTTEITDQQALFVNAFVTIQTALVVVGFVLSANTPELRILGLPDRAARSVWYLACAVIYVLGYSQLLFVPLISDGVSLFVGRAAAAVVSAAVVAVLILYVLANRRRVAEWLSNQGSGSALYQLAIPVLVRWHWPVLVYLVYLFINVLTRPGNVLLPLLRTTGEVLLVVIVASMVLTALTARAAQRVRIPQPIAERLPLLEERINQLRPAFMGIVRFLVLIVSLIVLLNLMGYHQGIGGFLSGAVLQKLSSGLLSVLLVTGLLALVWLAMTSWVDYRLNPFVGTVPTSREVTLLTLMKNAVTVAIIIVGIIMSLAQLGMNVGPLIASAGVIGLAISFGAQRMVEDIFSGIFIQAENAMNVGDVVDVGGTVGTVEKLTVRSVTLRDLSGVVHVIPFSSAAKISNFMRDYAYHVADMGVAYREDIEDVRVAMHEAFERLRADPEHAPDVIGDLEWFGLNSFGPSELVMRARIKTVPGKQWAIGRAYNSIVKQIFDERGIEIPFPHQTVYFGEDKSGKAPPIHLQVERPWRGKAKREGAGGSGQDDRVRGADHPEAEASDTHAEQPAAPLRDDRVRGSDHPDDDGR